METVALDSPLISIIVPIYNVEQYLENCIKSILNQTYKNIEAILVDDGSPDGSGAICDKYAALDPRIKVIHKKNGGVSSARNAGLKAACGEYIGWVDPDDWIELDMFEYLFSNLKSYDADVAVCSRRICYPSRTEDCVWKNTLVLNTEEALRQLLMDKQMRNYLWDKLWKAELFDGIVFPEGRTFEDVSVMHLLLERASQIVCLPEVKYNYLQRGDSIVGEHSLSGRVNHYIATRKRYDELRERWPQFEQLLEARCMETIVNTWQVYFINSESQTDTWQESLKQMAEFAYKHKSSALKHMDLGITGRIVLRLTPYAKFWAFYMAFLLYKLYLYVKHEK